MCLDGEPGDPEHRGVSRRLSTACMLTASTFVYGRKRYKDVLLARVYSVTQQPN